MVTWSNNKFYINGEATRIFSGSIHYFRSLPEQWYDLMYKLKCMGLNTVETYCAWNLHEPKENEFCFDGRVDLERFIKTAKDLGLWVIIRPGPYICAEYEFGGLPAWLLKDERMRLRTDEELYMNAVKRYFDQLIPRIVPHLETNGGNVILLAAENEYGSFGNSTRYMNKCVDMIKSYGVDVPIFTADGHRQMFLDGGHADNTMCALDFGYANGLHPEHFAPIKQFQPDVPIFHVEHWIGMFTQWGKPFQPYSAETVAGEIRQHLEMPNNSFNLYMFHGGTNYEFTNGANAFNTDPDDRTETKFFADTTSYDYDAPLTEWGECTPKYFAIQREMEKYLGVELPKPEKLPLQNIGRVDLKSSAGLFDNLENIGDKFESATLKSMEYFGQNYGYILYRTKITTDGADMIAFSHIADRVHIYFNGVYRGTLNRNDKKKYLEIDGWMTKGGTLDLLVENMGRIGFGPDMLIGDRKGLLDHVYISQVGGPRQLLHNFEVYTLPMNKLDGLKFDNPDTNLPKFYKGTFKTSEKKDCFIHPKGFTKGFIMVNGFLIGKYWNIGPQLSVYLPYPILKDENEIIIFDEEPVTEAYIEITDRHILDSMRTEEGPETIV